jgi:hypothetical protein
VPFRRLFPARLGPLGVALTAYDLWRRLPEAQRRQVMAAARKHGPKLASQAAQAAASRRRRPR